MRPFVIALLLAGIGTTAADAAIVELRTPSGNIACIGDTAPRASYVRCDIRARSWSPPPAPRSCELDWGQGLSLTARGRGRVVCAGDTALNAGPVLAYGRSRRIGSITCTSRTTGITCVNARGGGFALSRERYRLF